MQLFALDNNILIIASCAKKQTPYLCPECNGILHLRGGPHKQFHFYHQTTSPLCRQHKKTREHLHTQLHLLNLFPEGEATMERPFPSINRIADCVWETQKIVFEVQCSPISKQEVLSRCEDYESAGFEIIWVLHDKRFNKRDLSSAEDLLRERLCYFTNISPFGEGIIYDQFEIISLSKRLFKGPPLPVSLKNPLYLGDLGEPKSLALTSKTGRNRRIFRGDLLDRFARDLDKKETDSRFCSLENKYLALKIEPTTPIFQIIKRIYQILLDYIIKKTCG